MSLKTKVIEKGQSSGSLTNDQVSIGDTIELDTGKKRFIGVLMPKHEFSDPEVITIKLTNGYNMGLRSNSIKTIKLIKKGERINSYLKNPISTGSKTLKPKICVLGTGGTIASYVDYRTGAVHPATTAQDLAYSAPELLELATIEPKILFSELSENLTPKNWSELANEVAQALTKRVDSENDRYCGVIITHGTDTIGYTSAALSFILGPNLPAPVILVGSQRSSDRPSSDANQNLLGAAMIAIHSDLGEVVVVMHSSSSDDHITFHRGTKVRKMHTSRRDAFRTINEQPLGTVNLRDNSITIGPDYRKRQSATTKWDFTTNLNHNVCLIQTFPTIKSEMIDYFAENYSGLVLAGTGLGHAPARILESIRRAIKAGMHVVMSSQCINGRVNMNVYSNGRDFLKAGVIPAEDMLPETAYVKLMWVLGQTNDPDIVRKMMLTNYVGEVTPRSSIQTF